VGTDLPDASREGVARTASKEVAALPTNDATARPVSRRSSTYVFMSFDMEPCFMVSSDIAPFFMSFLLHAFLAMPPVDSSVVPDFIPEVFIPQLVPGLSILSP
jgi:hypothetical protein